jgi:two-component system sensor histidine kinase KdpD
VTALLDEAKITSEADREFLQVINEEADRLNRFVEEMMSLAQIEGGHLLLRRSPASADDIITNALDRSISGKVAVEVHVQEELPLLEVDAATIAQAMHEILENAARYSPPGTTVRVRARKAGTGSVEIAIENDGPPVSPEYRERVFEKFFRVPGSRRGQGFGIGLAIARGIVEAHGGRTWMDAAEGGHGTVVRFTVPCQEEK